MINAAENKIISEILDALNSIDPMLEETGSNVEVKWISDTGYVTVDFTNEHNEWIYEVTVQ